MIASKVSAAVIDALQPLLASQQSTDQSLRDVADALLSLSAQLESFGNEGDGANVLVERIDLLIAEIGHLSKAILGR